MASESGSNWRVKPVLQALILADRIYQDKDTGKKIIAGTFNQILLTRNPPPPGPNQTPRPPQAAFAQTHPGSPYAYISLTEVRGKTPLSLRLVDLADSRVLLQANMDVDHNDPLATLEIVVPLPVLQIPHPGVFALELLSDDEPLGSIRLVARERPTQPPNSDTPTLETPSA